MSKRAKWLLGLGLPGCVLVLAALGLDVYRCSCGEWVINCWSLLPPHCFCPFEEAAVHLRMVYAAQKEYEEITGHYAATPAEIVSRKIIDDAAFHTTATEIALHTSSAGWYATAPGLPGGRVLFIDETGVVREKEEAGTGRRP